MSKSDVVNPFHAGELEVQSRVGINNMVEIAGDFIRDFLPEQHREFHTSLPFLIVASADAEGKVWVTILEGEDNFIESQDPRNLVLNIELNNSDPLAEKFKAGVDVGAIGIELSTRRRNRFNGYIKKNNNQYSIAISQSFGNCPQNIHPRNWSRSTVPTGSKAIRSTSLNDAQIALIENSDTMFIGSGQFKGKEKNSHGYDTSHRGGSAGFVKVINNSFIQIPDYAGNNFFNTIGNLIIDPRVGLLFINFENGDLLHITGRASIDWQGQDTQIRRLINIEIDSVIDRPSAISLRWTKLQQESLELTLIDRQKESENITSFYFARADGQELKPFKAGQYLPIEIKLADQTNILKRYYSLSGSPQCPSHYRISVKRVNNGCVSSYFHNSLKIGDKIQAQQPAGNFVIPELTSPLILVSAGVGLTPLLSMLHSMKGKQSLVWYVHSARNGANHALHEEMTKLVETNKNFRKKIFYTQPDQSDLINRDFDIKGYITAEHLLDLDAGSNAHYMICGPINFITGLSRDLEKMGIADNQIHFEIFGTG